MTAPIPETAEETLLVDDIIRMIGSDAAENGFERDVILAKVRAGVIKEQVAVDYWESVASRSATLVDVSEAGSSRSLSQIRKNALDMAEYWRKRSGQGESNTPVKRRVTKIRPIERA